MVDTSPAAIIPDTNRDALGAHRVDTATWWFHTILAWIAWTALTGVDRAIDFWRRDVTTIEGKHALAIGGSVLVLFGAVVGIGVAR